MGDGPQVSGGGHGRRGRRPVALGAVALVLTAGIVGAVLLLVVPGRGRDEGESQPTSTDAEETALLAVQVDGGPAVLEAAAAVVTARLAALGVADADVRTADGAIEVVVPVADAAVAREALTGVGRFEVRPVLGMLPPGEGDEGLTPLDEQDADAEIVVRGTDGQTYQLGPRVLGDDGIEVAAATQGQPGQWTVNPVFREGSEGIDAFNGVAAECFQGRPTCPALSDTGRGLLAMVVDGVAVMVPSISAESFERDQIQISGDFDEVTARALAAKLTSPPSPAMLRVAE